MASSKPYIILVGDVGSGKSLLFEKITGTRNRSSKTSTIFTRSAEAVEALDRSLIICDTPGCNAMENRIENNLHIVQAMNFMPVSSVLTVFKADARIDNVVDKITNYSERFLSAEIPRELFGVCVTHMDTVEWGMDEIARFLNIQLGIKTVIFSAADYSGDFLRHDLKSMIQKIKPRMLHIESDTFLKLFKIADHNLNFFIDGNNELSKFKKLKQDFYNQRDEPGRYERTYQLMMTFEFKAWIHQEIIDAQKRLSDQHGAVHTTNNINQLGTILSDVGVDAMKYHQDFASQFRKCPHCGSI